jgi:hypothetical protein
MGWPERDIAQAGGFISPPGYARHRPESTLLYRLVAEHYPKFRDRRAAEERPLPRLRCAICLRPRPRNIVRRPLSDDLTDLDFDHKGSFLSITGAM